MKTWSRAALVAACIVLIAAAWWLVGPLIHFAASMLLGVLVVAGGVALAWFVIEAARSTPGAAGAAETPLEILKRRYAQGEITREQYEEMKRDLEQ